MAEILLIGSERDLAPSTRGLLRQDGHAVTWCKDPADWRRAERQVLPELIVATVGCSDRVIGPADRPARGFPAPMLFVQHESDLFRDTHVEERFVDRLASPFAAEEFLARVDGLVRLRRVIRRERVEPAGDAGRARLRGFGKNLAAVLGTRVPPYTRPSGPYREVAARVASWADRRDVFEPGHAERVASISAMIAEALGLPASETEPLIRAAMLHDIGKIAIPVELLRQQGPLEEPQMRLMRTHPERGATLLRVLDRDDDVVQAILYHHEQADGHGYYGRPPSTVPRAAKILGVAEAYDAITTSRVRENLASNDALAYLKERRGTCYDTACVDALADAIRPIRRTVYLRR